MSESNHRQEAEKIVGRITAGVLGADGNAYAELVTEFENCLIVQECGQIITADLISKLSSI